MRCNNSNNWQIYRIHVRPTGLQENSPVADWSSFLLHTLPFSTDCHCLSSTLHHHNERWRYPKAVIDFEPLKAANSSVDNHRNLFPRTDHLFEPTATLIGDCSERTSPDYDEYRITTQKAIQRSLHCLITSRVTRSVVSHIPAYGDLREFLIRRPNIATFQMNIFPSEQDIFETPRHKGIFARVPFAAKCVQSNAVRWFPLVSLRFWPSPKL